MTIGTLLIGLAVAILAVSYVARPFQRGHPVDLDQAIDRWVTQTRAQLSAEGDDAPVSFCPQCGRDVDPEHRFCPDCGTKLR